MRVKLCNGVTHAAPTWVPLDAEHWHFYRTGRRAGRPLSRCRACRAWEATIAALKNPDHGLVETAEVLQWIEELISRCDTLVGVEQAHGIPVSTLWPLLHGHRLTMQKRTAARIMRALVIQRANDRRNHATSNGYRSGLITVAVRDKKMMDEYAT